METKHTPGPWKAERMRLTPRPKDRRSGFVVNEVNDTREFGTRICDMRTPSGMDGFRECEANAALIAAAPDLLAALRGLIDWAATMGGFEATVWDRACAAADKAEARP